MGNKICLIYNFAQHYRENIFTLMDRELDIEFVFGDKYLDVKKMDYSLLRNFKKEVKNITVLRKPIYYQKGVLGLLLNDYSTFLMLGESICVSTWIMLFLVKLFNKRIFLWTHGWYGKETFFRRIAKKVFYSMADGVFLYGNYAKSLMIEEGFNKKKLHVIYNSLSYDFQIKERNKLFVSNIYQQKFNNCDKNLIFIGRLTKVKQINLLLDALQILRSNNINFNLILIGDGETKNELVEIVKKNGLENCVWFYGESYNERELSNLIYNADLCVSPGNVGLTAIHSMTYGTPVITHDNYPLQMPEFEAIEEGKTGDFFKYSSVASLAECIKNWFDNHKNREQIRKYCFSVVDTKYNPHVQIEIFKKHLS